MRTKHRMVAFFALVLSAAPGSIAIGETKLLNRSIYMPVRFQLCEHLEGALYYENERPVPTMPAERIFQFTYYPALERLLPEHVRIRIEGAYVGDGEPFVAKLAVAIDGIHTARSVKRLDTDEQIRKQLHKRDARLKRRTFEIDCKREARAACP